MLTDSIQKALKELCNEVKALIMARVWEEGVNPKTGTNTLISSDLIKNMKVEAVENGISLKIASYFEYVVLGWRRTHRFEGTFSSFINNILDWMRKKNVHVQGVKDNNLAWAIAMNIMNGGLMARPFLVYNKEGDLTKMLPTLNEYLDKWFDDLFNAIITDITKYFNK